MSDALCLYWGARHRAIFIVCQRGVLLFYGVLYLVEDDAVNHCHQWHYPCTCKRYSKPELVVVVASGWWWGASVQWCTSVVGRDEASPIQHDLCSVVKCEPSQFFL